MPQAWLNAESLQDRLPAIGAALAEGRLLITDAPLPPPTMTGDAALPPDTSSTAPVSPAGAGALTDQSRWAHQRWLGSLPALAPHSHSPGVLSAAYRLLPQSQPQGIPPDAAVAPLIRQGHGWLVRPVNFRLTTDSMLMDAALQTDMDASTAERLIATIRPLLADEGYDIEPLSPDTWLLRLRPGMPGWTLQTSLLEATAGRHLDDHLPQGPDARRFRRLLNEIQMSWHQEALHQDTELPANAVWLDGPISPELASSMAKLAADGLHRRDDFFLPRLYQDLGGWLHKLAQLDRHYKHHTQHQQKPDPHADHPQQAGAVAEGFACLLCGEHQASWLHDPTAAPLLQAWQASAAKPGDLAASRPGQTPSGAAVDADPTRQAATMQHTRPDTPRPPGLFRLMGELLSPREAWQALRERLSAARGPASSATGHAQPVHQPPRNPAEQQLHTLLSEAPHDS